MTCDGSQQMSGSEKKSIQNDPPCIKCGKVYFEKSFVDDSLCQGCYDRQRFQKEGKAQDTPVIAQQEASVFAHASQVATRFHIGRLSQQILDIQQKLSQLQCDLNKYDQSLISSSAMETDKHNKLRCLPLD
jgi:hypothetical protein